MDAPDHDLRIGFSVTPAQIAAGAVRDLRRFGAGAELYLSNDPLFRAGSVLADRWLHELREAKAALPFVAVHAPFWNLDLTAGDRWLRRHSRASLERAVTLAADLGAEKAILHSGLPFRRPPAEATAWLLRLADPLVALLEQADAAGLELLLENTTEPNPDTMLPLFESLPGLGFCFDVAHAAVFSETPDPQPWLDRLGGVWRHLHVSDSHGRYDEHLPPERGRLDLATPLRRAPAGLSVTLEIARIEPDALARVRALRRRVALPA